MEVTAKLGSYLSLSFEMLQGYPPDIQEKATLAGLEQAEVLSGGWAVA